MLAESVQLFNTIHMLIPEASGPFLSLLGIIIIAAAIYNSLLLFGSSQFFSLEINTSLAAERIIHTMPDPLLVCDRQSTIKVINNAFTEVFGYEHSELIDKKLHNCSNYTRLLSLIELLDTENSASIERSLYDRDKYLFPAQVSASHLFNRDNTISGTIFV